MQAFVQTVHFSTEKDKPYEMLMRLTRSPSEQRRLLLRQEPRSGANSRRRLANAAAAAAASNAEFPRNQQRRVQCSDRGFNRHVLLLRTTQRRNTEEDTRKREGAKQKKKLGCFLACLVFASCIVR